MKMWKAIFAVPTVLIASQAVAENWVTVAADPSGEHIMVDKDTIRRGDDGFVYYSDDNGSQSDAMAADCRNHLSYTLSMDLYIGKHLDFPDWRNHGEAIEPNSMGAAELQYACANAP